MINKRIPLLITLLLVVGILLSACGGAAPTVAPAVPLATQPVVQPTQPAVQPTSTAVPPTLTAEPPTPTVVQPTPVPLVTADPKGAPVYIGAITPLTDPGASAAGQLILRGINLGVTYVNTILGGSVDGRPVSIVIGDDKGTPAVGASEYRRLVQQYQIIGATGQYHSSVALAILEVAKVMGAPVIMTQASSSAITLTHYPEVFRTHLIDSVRAIALVDFAKSQGWKKIGYIADNTDFGTGLSKAVQDAAAAAGLDVKSTIYDKAAVDLTPELLQLQSWGPDVIFNAGTGNPEDIIITQANDIGLFPKVPMVATSDWPYRSDQFWKLHGDVGVGIYILTAYDKAMALTPSGAWFHDQYLKQYGEAPTYSSYNGFGDTVILAQAAKLAGSTDPAKVINALENNTFEFWAGTVSFPAGDGTLWHQWTPPVLFTQYTAVNQTQDQAQLIYTFNYKP